MSATVIIRHSTMDEVIAFVEQAEQIGRSLRPLRSAGSETVSCQSSEGSS